MSLSRTPTWRPKQDSLWQYTISTPVDLVLLQIILKVIYEYFPQHSTFLDVHKFIAFCDQRDSHNYDNDQLLENSNL